MSLDLPIASYLLPPCGGGGDDRIEQTTGWSPTGLPQWAVRSGRQCLSRALEWDYEPLVSSSLRTVEWMRQHRFDSAEEAFSYWQRWARRVEDDGR
jgi:hypothetical protein